MMKTIDYLFTGLYRLLLKTGDKDIAEYSALFLITIGLTSNFFLLLRLLSFAPQKFMSAREFGFLSFILFAVINYFYFISGNRYKILLEEAEIQSIEEKKIIRVISIIFCIESVAAPIIYSLIEDAILK